MKHFVKSVFSVILVIAVIASVAMLAGCGGSKTVTVPDVVGKAEADAEKEITDLGLVMTVKYSRFSDNNPEGAVDKMLTTAGEELEPGAEVKVVTSQGKGVMVPNMGPLTGKEAANLCTKVGLNPVIVEEYNDDVPEGNVIGYTDGGQTLPVGSDVTITVSKGPEA